MTASRRQALDDFAREGVAAARYDAFNGFDGQFNVWTSYMDIDSRNRGV
jgi:hypothetical protein